MNMENYGMLYENIVLAAWGKTWRRDDPLGLGDADTMSGFDNDLNGDNARDAKFGLAAAIKKVAKENSTNAAVYDPLMKLYNNVWAAKKYNDLCVILDKTKAIFNTIGFNII